VSAAGVADAVWDEAAADHVAALSMGASMGDILTDTSTGVAIAADGITSAKIADDAISAEHLNTGALTADAFAADAIVAATLATGALTADAFAADAIVAATLATDSITADAIADSAIDAGAIAAAAIGASEIATDAIGADEIASTAAAEIVAADEPRGVYVYRVHKNEPVAANRTVYFRAPGTLPANASISINGGAFASSTNAPATVNGNFRKLELSRAETNIEGRLVIDITTTSTVSYSTIIVDCSKEDPFTGRRTGGVY